MTICSSNVRIYGNQGDNILSYHPGTDILENAERNPPSLFLSTPRIAKDENYASAILSAWKSEVKNRPHNSRASIASPICYQDLDGCNLYGYLFRPSKSTFEELGVSTSKLPGIILFHTGAGPQDMFLRWKADALVTDSQVFPDGVVVLIADILGDETGWAWDTDRTRYERVTTSLLVPDENGDRFLLQSRVRAALDLIVAQPGVDNGRIGILGFCLGGHPVLELGRMVDSSVKALVTFHGVFGSVHKMKYASSSKAMTCSEGETEVDSTKKMSFRVLICTGNDDPFVSRVDVSSAKKMLEHFGHSVEIANYKYTKHGFTNPAQAYNTNPSFGYNPSSSSLAWEAMRNLLKDTLKAT